LARVVGPKGKHDPERAAERNGSAPGSVVLGSRTVPVRRPRAVRTDGSGEVGDQGVLFVLDGSKALAAGVQRVFGDRALVQRCQLHKRRNVGGYLPQGYAASVDRQLAKAFADTDAERGLKVAKGIAAQLDQPVRVLAPLAMAAGDAASYPEYVAAAKATQAWVAWQSGPPADVVTLAAEALELWETNVVSYSWYWLCLWPLIAVRLARGQLAEALEAGRQLLVPPQQRLPDELESMVQSAIAAWDNTERDLAGQRLGEALVLAQRLRYA
jgi:hypothetical protein